jgi:hypothetical protein
LPVVDRGEGIEKIELLNELKTWGKRASNAIQLGSFKASILFSNFRLTKMQRMHYASSHTDETVYKERLNLGPLIREVGKNVTKEESENGGNWDGL